jgi:hypothetical protein
MTSFSDRLLDELRAAELRGARRPGPSLRALAMAGTGALALAATVVVVALVGGDDTSTTGPAAGGPQLPRVGPADHCPVTTEGNGPVFPIGAGPALELAPPRNFASRSWWGQKVMWNQVPGAPGVTITGRRLDARGDVRFNTGDLPARSLRVPPADPASVARTPSFTRVQGPGCYAWIVQGPRVREVIVFRAIVLGHGNFGGSIQRGVRAVSLERSIVQPAGPATGAPPPDGASCQTPTRAERGRAPFGATRRPVFACFITSRSGAGSYFVQVLANGCWVAERRQGRGGLQGCGVRVRS